jgi:hypothetical protein
VKIRHWVGTNGSGMHHVAEACAAAERRLGKDSHIVDVGKPDLWHEAMDADIHVNHTDFPDSFRTQCIHPHRVVFVAHGTPEHVFENTIERFNHPGYGHPDGWQLVKHWLRFADATVTFWDRHAAFYRSLMPRRSQDLIKTVPLGVDRAFWAGGTSHGAYAGSPSVWMSENQHRIKWALDVIMAWPWVINELPQACLHAHYIPAGLYRWFVDLANDNDCAYKAHLSSATYPHESLRDIWRDLDFFLSPVRYGDHNNLFMQAAATGITTISYRGNPYADHWITEGDQRSMARELAHILKGDAEPREDKLPVPDFDDMGKAMLAIYEGL